MTTKFDLAGKRYGMLTGIRFSHREASGLAMWLFRCDCGKETVHSASRVNGGQRRSCGCLKVIVATTHGHTKNGAHTPEHGAWNGAKNRCLNPAAKLYRHYGGRGIAMCDRWRDSFEAFLVDMGRRPSPEHSIDRINNDGNYEPGNCRWATRQARMAHRPSPHGAAVSNAAAQGGYLMRPQHVVGGRWSW